jgi:hypothetical protein
MRGLKIIVAVMGVLLVAGTAALVAAIIGRLDRSRSPPVATASGPAAISVELPAGARILATALDGDRLLVRVGLGEEGEQLLLFNARTGAEIAVIALHSATGSQTKP